MSRSTGSITRLAWGGFWFGLALLAQPVSAAPSGVGVSPASQEVDVTAGRTTSGSLTVINDSATELTYRIYAADYRVSDESYAGDFTPIVETPNRSPVSWFTLPKGDQKLRGREQVKVPYTVSVPVTATVGGHYAAVFVETVPPAASPGSAIVPVKRIGSIFYLTVAGELVEQGDIESFDVPFLQISSSVTGSLRIKNSGNVHFPVRATTELQPIFVGEPAKLNSFGEVLPGTVRKFGLHIDTKPIGLYRMVTTIQRLGETEIISKMILVVPLPTLIIVSSTALLLAVLTFFLLGRKAHRHIKRRRHP